MCASSNCRSVRTSTTRAPASWWPTSWRGVRGGAWTSPPCSGPRLTSTIARKFGGCGPSRASAPATKRSSSRSASAALCARSKPIVEATFRSMPGPPHIDPPRWPGHTSVSSASGRRRSWRERKMSRAPSAGSIARSGRATSPTNMLSPVSTAHGRSASRRPSTSANAVCSGRWPGVCSARTRTSPSASSQPSSNGSCSYAAPAARWTWIVAPVAARRRPWPETWAACVCVSRAWAIAPPRNRASPREAAAPIFGSTTAATPACSSPIRYEAHPRSSWMSWRKITGAGAALPSRLTLSRHGDAVEVLGRLGIARVHRLERLDDDAAHRPVAEPLVVGRDDVPGRMLGRGAGDGLLVGLHVVVPPGALGQVPPLELPALGRIVEALAQPLGLLLARDVQEQLDDARAGVVQQRLEVVDVPVAPAPHRLVDEVVDARDEHVLVVRAVEDPDVAVARRGGVDAPEEVVRELVGRRLLERRDAHALRVRAGEHMLDGAVLPARVHRLQDDEERLARLGVEAVLEPHQLLRQLVERLFRRLLVAGRAVRVARIAVIEGERRPRRDEEAVAVARAHRAIHVSPWRSRCRCSDPCWVTTRNTAWSSSVPGLSTTCTSWSSRISAPDRSANAARQASSSSERSHPLSVARASASASLAASSSVRNAGSSARWRRPLATIPPIASTTISSTRTTMTISSALTRPITAARCARRDAPRPCA